MASEVLFYDVTVEQVQVLLDGLDANVQPIPLYPGQDPMKQLEQAVQNPDVQTIHVLGHGAPGEVILAGQKIDAQRIEASPISREQSASHSATTPFQIAFWSCKTGLGDTGMNFINIVANKFNALVSAATGLVGHEGQGGSWDLDVMAAPRAPFSVKALTEFQQVLINTAYAAPKLNSLTGTSVFTEGGVAGASIQGDPVQVFLQPRLLWQIRQLPLLVSAFRLRVFPSLQMK